MSGNPSFIAELQRRNVHRAAVFYAGAAWILVQVATQVFPFFHIPEGVVRGIVLLAVAGFPVAMLLSWYFEWTPQGIKRESEIPRGESVTRATGKALDRWIIAVLGVAVVVLLFNQFVLSKWRLDEVAADASIAVLPMANSTGDPANDYFSDGVSEELIGSLSRLSNLKVIGRTSSFKFKGKDEDSRTIGEQLGVHYLLEGSVRKSGDRVRIEVSLLKVEDGASIWAQTFDGDFKDIFAIQSEISASVARSLKVTLLGNNADTIRVPSAAAPSNESPEAYMALLQGNFHRNRRTTEDYRKAIGYYEEAIRLDAGYALAYAQLSYTAAAFVSAGFLHDKDREEIERLRATARTMAEKALALSPGLADAHLAQGLVDANLDLDLAAARAEYTQAAALSPSNAAVELRLGILQAEFGQLESAVDTERRAVVLDPLWSSPRANQGLALTALGRYDEAEAALRKAIELQPQAAGNFTELAIIQILRGDAAGALALARREPDAFWQTEALALSYEAMKDRASADAALNKLIQEDAEQSGSQIAQVYAARHEPDKAFEWLERARASHDGGVDAIRYDPFLLPYRPDPRYVAFGRRVGVIGPTEIP